jgi:AraC-like DNA-binding protein
MLTQDYLTLRLVRLKAPEEWTNQGIGLAFVFPRAGVGKCMSGPVTQQVAAGDAFVLNLAAGGKLCASDRGDLAFWCFSLSLEHLFPLFASNEICLLQNVTDIFKSAKMYPGSTPLARECHRLVGEVPPQFNLDHRSQLLRVAAAILTQEFKTAQPQRIGFVRAEEHMVQVFEKLSTNELLTLSVGELADKFGCSRRHLNRLFHQHFGVSVAALRMEMRLTKAVSLLRDPDAKVINVAEECGFNHLGLFNTCFKRRFGASPGQWRKLAAAGAKQPAGLLESAPECPLRTNGLCPWSGKTEDGNGATQATVQAPRPGPARLLVSAKGLDASRGGQTAANQPKIHEDVHRKNAPPSP